MDLEGGSGLHTDESAGVSFYAQPPQSSQCRVEAIKLARARRAHLFFVCCLSVCVGQH